MPSTRDAHPRWPGIFQAGVIAVSFFLASGLAGSPTPRPSGGPSPAQMDALSARFPGLSPQETRWQAIRCETALELLRQRGYLGRAAWKARWVLDRRAILADAYLASRPGHPPMDEAQLKQLFLAQGEQRRVSHILFDTEDEARKALDRLRQGASFQELAVALSKDPGSAAHQGDLGWIRKNQVVPEFGDPVFTAVPGKVIGPFHTDFGWHLALVQEIKPQRETDFPAAKAALQKQVSEAQAALKRQQALEQLRKRYPLTRDEAILGRDRGTAPASGDERRIAGRVAGRAIMLAQLKAYLAGVLKTVGQSHSLGAEVKGQFLESMADDIRLEAAARAAGLDRKPAVQASLWAGRMADAYLAFREVHLAGCRIPDPALKEHWKSHPDRFLGIGPLHIHVLVTDSEARAMAALGALQRGMAWDKAFEAYGDPAATGAWDPGWVESADLGHLLSLDDLRRLAEGPLAQVIGPFRGPDGFVLLQAVDRRPGTPLPFPACKTAVLKDYLAAHGTELTNGYLDRIARANPGRP